MTQNRRWRLVQAGTDAVPGSVRRFLRRARRRSPGERPARRLPPLRVIAAVVAVSALASWVLWGSTLLAVRQVEVTGTGWLSPAEVHDAAGVPGATPLLRVDTDDVARRVAELAPVRSVDVRRSLPDTLVIEVAEHTPAVAVPDGEGFRMVAGSGVPFATAAAPPEGVPVLEVDNPGPTDRATLAGLRVVAALTPQLRAVLDSVVVAGPVDIRLELRSGRTVRWGDESASGEKARVATALLPHDANVIDVSTPEVVVLD